MAQSKRDILFLDHDFEFGTRIQELLGNNGYNVRVSEKPADAISQMLDHGIPVALIGDNFQEMNSDYIIKSLRRINPGCVVLHFLEASQMDASRKGIGEVFDYLNRDITPELLLGHISRAYSFYIEKESTLRFVSENEERMKYQLEWLIWKQRVRIEEKMEFTGMILDSIRHSITQGLGIGSIITLSELLELDIKPSGNGDDRYSVSKNIIDSIINSGALIRSWLDSFSKVQTEFGKSYPVEEISSEKFQGIIENCILDLDFMKKIKRHVLRVSDLNITNVLFGNTEVLDLTLRELLVNAFKFSPEGSTVDVLTYKTGNSITLAVMNDIMPMSGGVSGIPKESENIVFEPFFRINNVIDERFLGGRSGMGLGLTMVQKIVNQTGGRLFIHEIKDHTDVNLKRRIIAELMFPVNVQDNKFQDTRVNQNVLQSN